MEVKRIEKDVIEVLRNKRKGIKLRVVHDPLLGYPCPDCCLRGNDRFCKGDGENELCLIVSSCSYFKKVDENWTLSV